MRLGGRAEVGEMLWEIWGMVTARQSSHTAIKPEKPLKEKNVV